MNTNETSNQSTTTNINFFSRTFTEIRTWWDGLLKPKKETPVERILENSRRHIEFITGLFVLCIGSILWIDYPYKNISWLAAILSIYSLLNECCFLSAARTSKEERLEFQKSEGKRTRRFLLLLFTIVAMSVIITQNFMGIGDIVTNALPWTKPASEATLDFINGVVEEFRYLLNH